MCVCVCVCVYLGSIPSLIYISLNNKDILRIYIFVYILSRGCIHFIVFGRN